MKRQMAPAALSGCSTPPEEGPADHPAAIMAGGGLSPSAGAGARRGAGGAAIGYTVSYTAAFPEQDGETGFDRESGSFRGKLQAVCRGMLTAVTSESGALVGFRVKGEVRTWNE